MTVFGLNSSKTRLVKKCIKRVFSVTCMPSLFCFYQAGTKPVDWGNRRNHFFKRPDFHTFRDEMLSVRLPDLESVRIPKLRNVDFYFLSLLLLLMELIYFVACV